MNKRKINIENYYTEEKEREGVWHEPIIDDKPCGLEFLLIGIHSEDAEAKLKEIDKKSDDVRGSSLEDSEKIKRLDELDAERVAVLTKDIRAKDGSELVMKGQPFKFSVEVAKDFYKNCPSIKMNNIDFVLKSSNFMILD